MNKTTGLKTGPSAIAKRNGGNGGYAKKSALKDKPMVRRKRNLRDYHGKKV